MSDHGYCHCGCGAKTTVAKESNTRRGHVLGQPVRYIRGHHFRQGPHDYIAEDRGHDTPCWIWQRRLNHGGYGALVRDGFYLAHRWYYARLVGPIPDGLQLDHLCRVPACVNPEHLEPVTQSVNLGRIPATTHCRKGHSLADAWVDRLGKRTCRPCRREREAQSREVRRAAA